MAADLHVSFPSDDEPEGPECPRLHMLATDDYFLTVGPGTRWPLGPTFRACTSGARDSNVTMLLAALFKYGRGDEEGAVACARAFVELVKLDGEPRPEGSADHVLARASADVLLKWKQSNERDEVWHMRNLAKGYQELEADLNEAQLALSDEKQLGARMATARHRALDERDEARDNLAQASRIWDGPETGDWLEGVRKEAPHQVARWGVAHDAGKEPGEFFWALGYLANKALAASIRGDVDKAKHHTISSGALLLNWHARLSGAGDAFRPGIAPPDSRPKDELVDAAAVKLPRRTYDPKESTAYPVFLVQRRRLQVTDPRGLEWDNDCEIYRDADGNELSGDDIVARDAGHWAWDVHTVAFTREEGEAYCERRSHNGPFRCYSIHSIGDLRKLLDAQTDHPEGHGS